MVEASNVGFLEQDTDGPPALNYVNFIVVNVGVVMPRFGDDEAHLRRVTNAWRRTLLLDVKRPFNLCLLCLYIE